MKALLVIGDGKIHRLKSAPSFKSFVKYIEGVKQKREEIYIINYQDVFDNNLPGIANHVLNIALFFPYEYWNKNIEVYKKDSRVYGDKKFGREYKIFFEKVDKLIKKKYCDKKIQYVNPPKSSILERDKGESKKLFQKKNIPTPESFDVKSPRDIRQILNQGIPLYIKPRFGAFGKGITCANKDAIVTNFLFRKGRIISRRYDYNWRFSKIKDKDRNGFLKAMLSNGCICEEAIDPSVYKDRRFDFRVYCIYGKIVYYYIRSTPASSPVTNWSQGGRIEKKKDFPKYISRDIIKRVKSLAKRVARELELNYAGIDIILSKDLKKAFVLEAHSFPGYEKGFDLMSCLAKNILKR